MSSPRSAGRKDQYNYPASFQKDTMTLEDRIAKEIAAEILEIYGPFNFPDDANGDTIDRAYARARIILALMWEDHIANS